MTAKRKSSKSTLKESLLNHLKGNIHNLIVIVLILLVLLQRCNDPKPPGTPTVVRDTVWVVKDSTIYSRPQIIKTIPIDVPRETIIKEYLPDTNYNALLKQYESVVNELLAKNIQRDSISVDSIGYVKITDTVQKNMVVGRSTQVNVKYPIIKETITLPAPITRQVYAGGQISGNSAELINGINAGLLLKNKRDQIYGVTIGLNTNGQVSYGLQSYWKIKLK